MASGDRSAQAEFDSLVRNQLDRYITKEFGKGLDNGDSYEIVSQSILIMYLQAGEYRGKHGESSAWAWAFQVARSQAIKWVKTRKREVRIQEMDDGYDLSEEILYRMVVRYSPDDEPVSVEQRVEERLFREMAAEILQKLNKRERLILHLHFEKDWTLRQIAEYLNVKPPRITQIMQNIRRVCLEEMTKAA